jgi:urease accessory protein
MLRLASRIRNIHSFKRIAARRWNGRLDASREAAELQREDQHLGTALARLLADLGFDEAVPWRNAPRVCFATLFGLAAVKWDIPLSEAATGYAWLGPRTR